MEGVQKPLFDWRATAFSFKALGYVAVRIINFQITTRGPGDAVWKNHEVHPTRVFGRGILESGDMAGIVGELPKQLSGRVWRGGPVAGQFLRSCAKGCLRRWIGQTDVPPIFVN